MEHNENLEHLEKLFMNAMEYRQNGNVDKAEKILLQILKEEPRLAEPHLELAHIYFNTGKQQEALNHIKDCIEYLEKGGQWIEIEENILLSMAYTIQGEIYQSMADRDEVIFGDQEAWKDLITASKKSFTKAKELDPENGEAVSRGANHNWIIKD